MNDNQQLRCPHCGRTQLFDDEICPYCGQTMTRGRRRIVTVKQRADRQRAIQKKNWNRPQEKTTWIPQQPNGVWTGPETKRTSGKKKIPLKKAAVYLVIFAVLYQIVPLVLHIAMRDFMADRQITDVFKQDDGPIPTFGRESYIYTTDEELDALDPGALWKRPQDWDNLFPGITEEEKTTLEAAADFVESSDESRETLLRNMEAQNIPPKAAAKALRMLEVDWNIQALRCMLGYLRYSIFSPREMWEQLEYEQFTREQIQYAMDHCNIDWYHEMEMQVPERLLYNNYSEQGMREELLQDGYLPEDIDRYLEGCGVDWRDQAVRQVEYLKEELDLSGTEAAQWLEEDGFPPEDISWALAEMRK